MPNLRLKEIFFLLLFFAMSGVQSSFSSPGKIHFVILHTNDMHGHALPYLFKKADSGTVMVGGLDRLAGLVTEIRAKGPVLLLDAGDISQGTPVSNFYFGLPMAKAMNIMRYDAAAVGNHEFDWGVDHLEKFIAWCHFPILAANVMEKLPDNRTVELPNTKPDLLETVDGVKIGIIGVVTPATPVISKPENMKHLVFLPPAPVVKKYIPALRKKGAQIILVLSHLGFDDDQVLARAVPEIDLIVGGHSHTVLEKPIRVGRTMIVQTGSYCRFLGEINVSMSGKNPRFSYHLIPVYTGKIKPDPRVSLVLHHYEKEVAPVINRVLGVLQVDLTRNRAGESTLGDVIADAMREAAHVDLAFQNSGGIRADLYKGEVRWGDVFTVLPFDDDLVTMDLKGSEIKNILEQSVSGKSGLIQVSGLRYTFKETVLNGTVSRTLDSIFIGGEKFEPEKTYRVATSDFLSTGGDGFRTFKNGKNVVHGRLIRSIVINYFQKNSPFTFRPSSRIIKE